MKLYVVCNSEGKFFRSKGYNGYGDSWVSELEKAKFYSKFGQAQSRCTFWYGAYPKYGCPVILEFTIQPEQAIQHRMIDIAQASIDKKIKKKQKRENDRKAYYALQDLHKAKQLIKTLTVEQKKELGIV
jgi:hypothetical protein